MGDGVRDNARLFGFDGGREREQRIYTPPEIVEAVRVALCGPIALDPCWGPDAVTCPDRCACPDEPGADYPDGLSIPWPDRTFANPPYDTLKEWMNKAAVESAADPSKRIVMLIPARPHRSWWRGVAFTRATSIVWLDPVKFHGYDQAFPSPLVLLGFGPVRWDGDVPGHPAHVINGPHYGTHWGYGSMVYPLQPGLFGYPQ